MTVEHSASVTGCKNKLLDNRTNLKNFRQRISLYLQIFLEDLNKSVQFYRISLGQAFILGHPPGKSRVGCNFV